MASGIGSWNPPQWEKFENTEKVVGTWIDGSLVYQRTFSGNLPTSLSTFSMDGMEFPYIAVVALPADIRSTVNIIKITGWVTWVYQSLSGILILNMGRDYNNSIYAFYGKNGVIGLTGGSKENSLGQPYEITVEYVK